MFGKELFNIKLKGLLANSFYGINEKDENGETVLHRAVQCSHYEVIKLLIEKGADVNARNNSEETPLHEAVFCREEGVENIRALLEEGADIDAVDESGNTPLHLASMMSCAGKVKALINAGANVNVKNNIGRTALHQAVFMRELECVRVILKAGGKVDAVDHSGYTPIDFAYKANVEEIIKELEKYSNRNIFIIAGLYATSRKQIEELKNRIVKDEHELLEEKFMGKAGLESLRYRAAKGRIDKVYIYSPADLAKEFKDQISLLREFWQFGVEIIFLSEKIKVEITEDLICFRSSYGW